MKKVQIASIHLLSIVNDMQIVSLHGIKREIVVFTSAFQNSANIKYRRSYTTW